MTRFCKHCNARITDDRLIACPDCGATDFGGADTLQPLTPEQQQQLLRALTTRVARYIFGGFSLLTVISVVTILWSIKDLYSGAVTRLEQMLTDRVAAEFDQARVAQTVEQVAGKEAQQILRDQVQPELERFRKETAESLKEIKGARERTLAIEQELSKIAEMARPPSLEFVQQSVTAADGRYVCTLVFKPSKNAPLGQVVLHATIADNSPAKIVDFWPTQGKMAFLSGDNSKQIGTDGKSAQLAFQPLGVGYVTIDVVLSAPSRITIEGTHEIKPFLVDIR